MSDNMLHKLEMSRYIDLELYHAVERTHPFYMEMVGEICREIESFCKAKNRNYKVLELGAGTGLFTHDLLKLSFLDVSALEIDKDCYEILKQYLNHHKCNLIHDDAITHSNQNYYDIVVSTFAHDHIHHDKSGLFTKNIKQNLKKGGIYIMGGEILPYYSNSEERRESLYKYHCFIINKALREGHFEVGQIEISALKSGIDMIGDFKRHEAMFEEEVTSSGLKLITKKKIGPLDIDDVGGVFVYVFSA